ncbi:MAG TPA: 23S rRNA (adenine(2503)-C(2))-methyltransferase RlmN [Polyangiaceae bacterium]|nr:23S rRNA (adenine(2503)-C(2))-methyltransferase RlmN [Polyangiaceae bacterium]
MTSSVDPVGRLPEEWREAMTVLGEKPFRAEQIFRWIHERGVLDPEDMTDLSKALRERLKVEGFAPPAKISQVHAAADGTRKLVLELAHGARVECVIIPMTDLTDADAAAAPQDDEDDAPPAAAETTRITLCVSTQYGCAMGCVFCASGQAGLQRGLTASEIVSQVLLSKTLLEPNEELKNLVFMGMGEPLHHYEETARAIRLLTHPLARGMSPRRITVSTVGLVPGIARLGADFGGKVGLAVSLHAPNDAVRDRIMPMNRKFPIAELIQALHDYPLPQRRRITVEYTLMDGVNDSEAQARELVQLLRGLRVKVNLIPMNPISASELKAPSQARVVAFQRVLAEAGLSCFVRTRRGDEVSAACGQLAIADDLVRKKRERDAQRKVEN